MASVNGNTILVTVADDDTTVISDKNVALVGVLLTAGGGAGHLALGDNISGASYPDKLELDVDATGTQYLDLSSAPIIFSNGIRVKTVTGTPIVTLVIRR